MKLVKQDNFFFNYLFQHDLCARTHGKNTGGSYNRKRGVQMMSQKNETCAHISHPFSFSPIKFDDKNYCRCDHQQRSFCEYSHLSQSVSKGSFLLCRSANGSRCSNPINLFKLKRASKKTPPTFKASGFKKSCIDDSKGTYMSVEVSRIALLRACASSYLVPCDEYPPIIEELWGVIVGSIRRVRPSTSYTSC